MVALPNRRQPALPVAANDPLPAERTLLRFITCGSVDDGKSTLIGRLLVEAGAIPDDVLATLHADSRRLGNADGALDYSLLVDGLQAEREQGITVDVAYRYFATARRSFIVADTPGHEQYTRNMATGASGADLAIILIDARKGVLAQTRRHSLIVSLVGVKHVVVAINKIDLIGYDEATIAAIAADYQAAVAELGFDRVTIIPVSAREGDNIVARSPRTPWYEGPTLLRWLETVEAVPGATATRFVMPVQWVNRPNLDFRGFAGTITAGVVKPGDAVLALPSGQRATVARIVTFDGDLERAGTGQAVTLVLDREIDVSRGDVLLSAEQPRDLALRARETVDVRLLATADRGIAAGDSFLARIGTATVNAVVKQVRHAIDVTTLRPREAMSLQPNDLGLVRLHFDKPVITAPYAASSALGALILIDRMSNATAAMGVVLADEPRAHDGALAFRRVAERTLTNAIGPAWRREIAPAASWWLGSAGLLGVVVGLLTGDPVWAIAAAGLDAVIRPAARYGHCAVWLWARQARERDAVSDGGGI